MKKKWLQKKPKNLNHGTWIGLILICLHLLPGFAGGVNHAVAREILLEKATLEREHDAVIVKGESLGPIQGTPISSLRLFSYRHGQFQVIPFQVDERDPKGEYVLPSGPKVIKDVDHGILDYNDELVFMARDAGDRISNVTDDVLKADKWIEIEILDPINLSHKAWVYFCFFSSSLPALSPVDYVTYDVEKEQIFSENYGLGYNKGMVLYTDLFYPDGKGGFGPDLLDRIKVRINVKFFLNIVRVKKNEGDFRAEVVSWKDGPVRVLRNVQSYVRILLNLSSPSVFAVSEYYADYMFTPLQITVPGNLKWIFSSFGISDFTWHFYGDLPGLEGGVIYTNRYLQGIPISVDNAMDWYTKNIDTHNLAWGCAVKQNTGVWFCNLVIPDILYPFTNLYLNLDKEHAYPPEDIPGEIAGGAFMGWKDFDKKIFDYLQPGIYELALETFFPPSGFSPENVQEWRNIREFPVQVIIRRSRPTYSESSVSPDATTIDPIRSRQGTPMMLTDIHGKNIFLYDVKLHTGSIRATGFDFVTGRDAKTKKWYKIPFYEILSVNLRVEEEDAVSGLKRPLIAEITQKDGAVLQLIACKCCTLSGSRSDGKRVGYLLSQLTQLAAFEVVKNALQTDL